MVRGNLLYCFLVEVDSCRGWPFPVTRLRCSKQECHCKAQQRRMAEAKRRPGVVTTVHLMSPRIEGLVRGQLSTAPDRVGVWFDGTHAKRQPLCVGTSPFRWWAIVGSSLVAWFSHCCRRLTFQQVRKQEEAAHNTL